MIKSKLRVVAWTGKKKIKLAYILLLYYKYSFNFNLKGVWHSWYCIFNRSLVKTEPKWI